MHAEAHDWVEQYATTARVSVVELGARDVNGSMRNLFRNARPYRTLDILPGPGVDIVADAGSWVPDRLYDYVVTCETFEHTYNWPSICRVAYAALKPGGVFVVTCAGPGRHIHSGIDGQLRLMPYEQYANVPGYELERVLTETGFHDIVVDTLETTHDTRSVAVK